ncbi:MAG TPA: hypothetical protein VE569_04830 [Acidimicrobiia bacterium]|nr:hypothetical protein [Acidimicrobiia bacterium]
MNQTKQVYCQPILFIRPPYVLAPNIGVVAIDVTYGAMTEINDHDMPLLCMGGHPALECLLDVKGSGPNHDIALAGDRNSSAHRMMIERMRTVLDPRITLQVVDTSNR